MSKSGVPFKLVGISTEQFAFLEESYMDDGALGIEFSLRQGIDPKKNGFSVFLTVSYLANEKVFLKLEVGCHFEIEKESWKEFMRQEDQRIVFPKGLIQHLSVITVGTTRGVLHAKTENTRLHGLFLPTLDLTQVIAEDVPFDLD
jgi:hypothetical protein